MKLEAACPVCSQDAYLAWERPGWLVRCSYCQRRVIGHVHPAAAIRAFMSEVRQRCVRVASLPGQQTERFIKKVRA